MKIIQNIKKNNYIKLVIVVTIFFMSSLFRLVPTLLFNIEPDTPLKSSIVALMGNTITCLIMIYIYRKTLIKDLKAFKDNFSNLIEKGIKYWLIGLVAMMISNLIISFILSGELANNEENVRNLLNTTPIIAFLMTGILAPITEELVFRKAFLSVFKDKWPFVLISGIIFGSLHVFLSLDSIFQLLYLVPYCSLGIAFSYMYYETKNIMVPIIIHMVHNSLLSIFSIIQIGMILW